MAHSMGATVSSPEQESALKPRDEFAERKKGCPTMVVVPAGSFTMGSAKSEIDHSRDEEPQHEVAFARPFAIAKRRLSFAEWDVCVDAGACQVASDIGWGARRSTGNQCELGRRQALLRLAYR